MVIGSMAEICAGLCKQLCMPSRHSTLILWRPGAQARKERTAVLQAGAPMKLLSYRGSTNAKVQLSSDGAMVTWQTERTGPDQPGESGVIALAMIREIKPVMQSGLGALLGSKEVPLQWMIVADEETVKFEAESETARQTWMSTLDELSKRQQEAKAERKMGYAAQRQMGIEQRRREAERRKAEVLKTCGGGGMKHTAKAMMSRN
eukprot:6205625-Pleurochrysis_carterae.AAC.3